MNPELDLSPFQRIAYVAVFGGLWGAMECTVGAFLHVMNFPLVGLLMAGIGVGCALVGYRYAPHKGTLVQMGIVAATLKLFSIGGVRLVPFLSIVGEAALAEAVVIIFGVGIFSYILAEIMACLLPLLLPLIVLGIFMGTGIYQTLIDLLDKISKFCGFSTIGFWLILAIFVALHFIVGIISGVLSWSLSGFVSRRMGLVYQGAQVKERRVGGTDLK